MKSFRLSMGAILCAILAACGQDPRLAALETEMKAELQRMAMSGATTEQMAAYQASVFAKAQEIQASQVASQVAGMSSGGYPEPTEEEMRSVFEAQFDNARDRVDSMADQCNNVRSSNDPMVGMACLFGSVGQSSSAQVGLSSFQKIACEKSPKPGYNCDYIIGVSAAALSAFGGGGSEAQSKRFVKSDGRWIAFDY